MKTRKNKGNAAKLSFEPKMNVDFTVIKTQSNSAQRNVIYCTVGHKKPRGELLPCAIQNRAEGSERARLAPRK